ncbi:MAG: hypothetical protein K2P78_12805 [Gemmataceae bacterium]|nr:hypothetical protein [Gemmataceae bacterium]
MPLVRIRSVPFVACAVLALAPVGDAQAQSSEQLLQEVKAGWQARQDAIKSARFTWGQKTLHAKGCWSQDPPLPPTDVIDDGSGSLLVAGERIRLETRALIWHQPAGEFFPRHRQVAFDGEKHVALDGPGVLRWHQATVNNKSRPKPDIQSLELWPLRVALRPNWSSKVFGTEILGPFASARRVVLESRTFIELTKGRAEVQGEARMWVDPVRGYGVVRYDSYLRDGSLYYRIDIRPGQRTGQWLPETWKVQLFRDKGKLDRSSDVTLRECELNPELPDEVFRIDFPVGTIVVDMSAESEQERTPEVRYLVRENGERRIIDPLERGVPYERLMATKSGELATRRAVSWWNRRWVMPTAIGSGLLLVGLSMVVIGRRRRNRLKQASVHPVANTTQ